MTPNPHGFKAKKKIISGIYKVFWIASVLMSSALCIWQLVLCLEKYFGKPVGTKTKIETFDQFTTPSLTLCPNNINPTYTFKRTFDPICKKSRACHKLNKNSRQHFPFNELNITLQDLWQPNTKITIAEGEKCKYAVNHTQCKSNNWSKHRHVNTVAGPCLVFYSNQQRYYIRNPWPLWLELHNVHRNYKVDVHTSSLTSVIFLGSVDVTKGNLNILKPSETKFEHLNTTKNPCVTQDEEIQCMNKWFNDQLQRPDVKCRWPFMNSTLPFCNSMNEVNKLENKILQIQFSRIKTNCKQSCSRTEFQITSTVIKSNNSTAIAITFGKNTRLIVSEYFIYPLPSLVSDVGGNIGLFLAISLLYSLNLFQDFIDKLVD
uniref:Uncharacterized protein n=1 Tax=Strigamia maritima TaxID=126957 RepID=T1IJE3_STRMM